MASSAKVFAPSEMRIIIRDLKLDMVIGIHSHEKLKAQEVLVNLEALVTEPDDWKKDNLADRVCYEEVVHLINDLATQNGFKLLETFAHELVELLLRDRSHFLLDIRLSSGKNRRHNPVRAASVSNFWHKKQTQRPTPDFIYTARKLDRWFFSRLRP